jgi:hypothetical protein
MRHYLRGEVGNEPIAIPRLPSGMQAPGAELAAVHHPGASERLPPPSATALGAERLAAIAAAAESKLNPTTPAAREPILLQCHETPWRRFLDMGLRPW